MPLSASVMKELEGELKQEEARLQRFHKDRAKLDAEIEVLTETIRAIRSLLGKQATEASQLTLSPASTHSRDDMATLGVREAIRSVLGSSPQGLKPRELAKLLKQRGFQHGGQTDLGARISSEMWRMERSDQLHKTKEGRYTLVLQEG